MRLAHTPVFVPNVLIIPGVQDRKTEFVGLLPLGLMQGSMHRGLEIMEKHGDSQRRVTKGVTHSSPSHSRCRWTGFGARISSIRSNRIQGNITSEFVDSAKISRKVLSGAVLNSHE